MHYKHCHKLNYCMIIFIVLQLLYSYVESLLYPEAVQVKAWFGFYVLGAYFKNTHVPQITSTAHCYNVPSRRISIFSKH